jgi:hypothetical protein
MNQIRLSEIPEPLWKIVSGSGKVYYYDFQVKSIQFIHNMYRVYFYCQDENRVHESGEYRYTPEQAENVILNIIS